MGAPAVTISIPNLPDKFRVCRGRNLNPVLLPFPALWGRRRGRDAPFPQAEGHLRFAPNMVQVSCMNSRRAESALMTTMADSDERKLRADYELSTD